MLTVSTLSESNLETSTFTLKSQPSTSCRDELLFYITVVCSVVVMNLFPDD